MKKMITTIGLLAALAAGCAREATELKAGADVALKTKDGVAVEGRIVEVQAEQVVIESKDQKRTTVRRADIAEVKTESPAPNAAATSGDPAPAKSQAASGSPAASDAAPAKGPSADAAPPAADAPAFHELTLPAGTVLTVTLRNAVASDTSSVEDQVRGTVARAVKVGGVEAVPAGSAVVGHVTSATRSARVKGRAQVAFRFTRLDLPGEGGATDISTAPVSRVAEATKKRDAATIGGGAVGGAIIGGIIGGGDGAAKGAVVGGAAGTGAVLATRGKEVRLEPGTPVSVKLTAPLTVRVPRS